MALLYENFLLGLWIFINEQQNETSTTRKGENIEFSDTGTKTINTCEACQDVESPEIFPGKTAKK